MSQAAAGVKPDVNSGQGRIMTGRDTTPSAHLRRAAANTRRRPPSLLPFNCCGEPEGRFQRSVIVKRTIRGGKKAAAGTSNCFPAASTRSFGDGPRNRAPSPTAVSLGHRSRSTWPVRHRPTQNLVVMVGRHALRVGADWRSDSGTSRSVANPQRDVCNANARNAWVHRADTCAFDGWTSGLAAGPHGGLRPCWHVYRSLGCNGCERGRNQGHKPTERHRNRWSTCWFGDVCTRVHCSGDPGSPVPVERRSQVLLPCERRDRHIFRHSVHSNSPEAVAAQIGTASQPAALEITSSSVNWGSSGSPGRPPLPPGQVLQPHRSVKNAACTHSRRVRVTVAGRGFDHFRGFTKNAGH